MVKLARQKSGIEGRGAVEEEGQAEKGTQEGNM